MSIAGRVFLVVILAFLFKYSAAQKLLIPEPNSLQGRFIHYPVTESGADISTNKLFFDSNGFLWEGTFNGLYRYDGNKHASYGSGTTPGQSLAGRIVTDIFEDRDGIMWIGTYGALNRFDRNTGKIIQFIPDTSDYLSSNNRILHIEEDNYGLLWIITNGHVFAFDRQKSVFSGYSLGGPGSSWTNKPGQFLEDSGGRIWIVSATGLNKYDRERNRFVTYSYDPDNTSGISCNSVNCITEDKSGTLWCGTNGGGLNRITDPEKGVFERARLSSRGNHRLDTIQKVLPASDETLWIFGNSVFASYFPESGELKSYKVGPVNHLFNNSRGHKLQFEDAFQDEEGSLWFLDRKGLVFSFEPGSERLRLFGVPNWVIFDWVRDDYGSIWFGCANGNKWRLMLNTVPYTSLHVPNMFNVSVVRNPRIAGENNGKLWLTLSTGIYSSDFDDDPDVNFKKIRLPTGDTVAYSIRMDKSGNLWMGLSNGRVVRLSSGINKYKTFHLPDNVHDIINNIVEDNLGNIWFISNYKIYLMHPGSDYIRNFIIENKELNEALKDGIFDINIDDNETIWFGAFSNCVHAYNFKTKSLTSYFSKQKEELRTGDYCIRINQGAGGRKWILFGYSGLYYLDQDNREMVPVRLMDQIPSGIFYTDLFIDKSGRVMIFHNYGLTVYNPETSDIRLIYYSQQPGSYYTCQLSTGQILNLSGTELKLFQETIPYNNVIPEVYLTGISVNDQPLNTLKAGGEETTSLERLELRHRQNNLRFEFASMNFLYPENNRYKYFMKGLDEDTILLNSYKPVEYRNLRSGRYSLWFTGSNNDGVWNAEGKTIDIHIKPPFTSSLFAFIAYLILFLLSLAVFMRRHFHRLNSEKKRLENEVHIRTLELEKKNQEIEQIDRMKTRFFTEISHELRTPLSLIIGPVDNLIAGNGMMDEARRSGLLDMIKRNGMRLLNLVNQLLDISRIDAGKMKITLAESDLLKSLRILIFEYLSTADSRKIKFNIDIPDGSYITFFDRDKIEKIVSNLLSNAFKFTPAHGTVHCKIGISEAGDNESPAILTISVRDSGVGISKDNLDKIFDRFYRVEGEWEKDGRGTGIGLSLTDEFVTLLHGNIEVTSEKETGSAFTVRFPVGKDHLSPGEYVLTDAHPYGQGETEIYVDHASVLKEKEMESAGKKIQVLVIEDNRDLREFLKENLSDNYHVFEADNGKTGLNIAFARIPDIIVTDIIMPDLDGIEVCRKIRHDERTSHIPVIILTAKTTSENRIEGLTTGADDYLSKPFDINELRVRISNLLAQRTRLRLKYGLIGEIGENEAAADTLDSSFMKKVNQIIAENIRNFDFDVGVLQEKLGMSRINLYRKLKALTGQTPVSVIHQFRMKVAARMIREKRGNLAEISLSVGISNPSYFSRIFREFYGVSPKDFVNEPEDAGKV